MKSLYHTLGTMKHWLSKEMRHKILRKARQAIGRKTYQFKHRQSGEKMLHDMTLHRACQIMGLELPSEADGDTRIGQVYSHPALCRKGSVVLCPNSKKEIIREALNKGASLVAVNSRIKREQYMDDPRVVGCDNVYRCISRYERYIRTMFPAKVITVTGSVGKSTTTEMIRTVFGNAFKIHVNPSVTNSMSGALRVLQRLHDDDKFYLQELGAAEPDYIRVSAEGLTPDAVVITNIGEAHLDGYGSKAGILKDKASLVENMAKGGVAFFDKDDEMLRNYRTSRHVVYYALEDKTADYIAEHIRNENGMQVFEIVEHATGCRYAAKIRLPGDFNVRNALAAFAMGRHFGIAAESILLSLQAYQPSGIRQNICHIAGHTLYLDTFNSAPNTLIGSAKVLGTIPLEEGGRRILVAGDIAHLGEEAETIHYRVGRDLARENFDLLITFGSLAANIYRGAKDAGFANAIHFDEGDRESLNNWLRENITAKDITLYKGCQAINLPMTIDAIYGTVFYHQNEYVYVSEEQLELDGVPVLYSNVGVYRQFKKLLDRNTEKLKIQDDGIIRRIAPSACAKTKLQAVEIPDRVVNIGESAFYSCYQLTDVKLPQELLYIEPNAFNSCISLKEMVLPNKTRHIAERAFRDCYELHALTVPQSVGYIAPDAFQNCKKLELSGKAGSYAESYATEHGIPFHPI